MGLLPVLKKQTAGRTFMRGFLISVDHIAGKQKSELGIFMIMPVNIIVGIVRIIEDDPIQTEGFICFPVKLARP